MLREAADYRGGRAGFDDELLRAEDARALQALERGLREGLQRASEASS